MAKWIFDLNGLKELHRFNSTTEYNNVPLGIGRTKAWVIIPNDAIYEGM